MTQNESNVGIKALALSIVERVRDLEARYAAGEPVYASMAARIEGRNPIDVFGLDAEMAEREHLDHLETERQLDEEYEAASEWNREADWSL